MRTHREETQLHTRAELRLGHHIALDPAKLNPHLMSIFSRLAYNRIKILVSIEILSNLSHGIQRLILARIQHKYDSNLALEFRQRSQGLQIRLAQFRVEAEL